MEPKMVESIIAEDEETRMQRQDLIRKKQEIVEAEKLCTKIEMKAEYVSFRTYILPRRAEGC